MAGRLPGTSQLAKKHSKTTRIKSLFGAFMPPAILASAALVSSNPSVYNASRQGESLSGGMPMPVEGFPDPRRHKICLRCQKWHEPDEGMMIEPEPAWPFSVASRMAKQIAGMEPPMRFICHRCLRIRRYTKAAIFGTFAFLVVVALILGWLKVI